MRAGIVAILAAEPDISVVADAVGVGSIGGLIRRHAPNVVVSESEPALRSAFGELPVIAMCDSIVEVDQVVRAGVRGIVLRSDARRRLVRAVREVVSGNAYIAPSAAGYVLDQLCVRIPTVDPLVSRGFELLTAREREVLRLIAMGMSTVEVAATLHRTRATIKSHISHILAKLGVQDRGQAIALAYRFGLVSVGDRAPAEPVYLTALSG
ncbi:response regulator transcription factor [Nocardia sp. CDC159]|uniref:Response regulator transcription factor n=1 Tax=Nocardia pulmonis TaxID=2951408 RepID=A0A9X2E701_9NOCA|nr:MULTISPECIES: response regulator transcription factor [Nocardia]MCM6773985.1 response regulator transcription factor [Nocardia pulmonis]MCM6786872.1 response regulator transcription factor [Nocardia sp. CDC159]